MVTVLQRVSEGRVTVKGRVTGSIHDGLVIIERGVGQVLTMQLRQRKRADSTIIFVLG